MKVRFLTTRSKKFLPFLIIIVVVMMLLEYQKSGPLPGPEMTLLEAEMRSAEGTEFSLPELSGKNRRLSDFKGNVMVLNFFATWCGPCREEMPSLEQLFQAYKNKDFVVLGVSGDVQGKEVVEPFVEEFQVTFPVVLDTENVVSRQYAVRGIPTVYLLDRQGKIAGMHVGGADWNGKAARALIDQLLDES